MSRPEMPATAAPTLSQSPAIEHPDANDDKLLQRPFVQNILPFLTSLSVHAGILIFGLLVFGAVKMVQIPTVPEQIIVADSPFIQDGPIGGTSTVGLADLFSQATQDKDPVSASTGWAPARGPTVDPTPPGVASDASIFDAGSLSNVGGTKGAHGPGAGDGSGLLSRFGEPTEGGLGAVFRDGAGPPGTGNARMIVFLCDGTGSMINKMATLKDELNKTVVRLRRIQSFDIIFYQGVKVEPMAPTLIPATPENKRKAGTFLDGVTATDTTDPIPPMIAALKLKPQLLYFLTDAADFPDPQALLDAIKKFNPKNETKINTILFVENKAEREKNADSEGLMQKIASESGGKFRWVEMDQIP